MRVSPGLISNLAAYTWGTAVLAVGIGIASPSGAAPVASTLPCTEDGRLKRSVPLPGSTHVVLLELSIRNVSFTDIAPPAVGWNTSMCFDTATGRGGRVALKTSSVMPVVGVPGGNMRL